LVSVKGFEVNIYIRSQETDLFKYLSDESTAFLMKEAVSQTVSARECVFHHGTRPEYIVILVSGELEPPLYTLSVLIMTA
jgi:hypothetical protein